MDPGTLRGADQAFICQHENLNIPPAHLTVSYRLEDSDKEKL